MANISKEILGDEDLSIYPENVLAYAKSPSHFGRMNDPTASAFIKGPCGDEMEFYLTIKHGIIEEIKFCIKGCMSTLACGEATARLAEGKSIDEALGISPKQVIGALGKLPEDHSHCSILAVSTLYRAIADYLLKG
ncbi:MAG: iron-sulfur cluster assembly scaffold protein [Candidatus Omnitrophica bacterium]|nr:iron-sulfur cluster assembly scaffold protein [Candidatus Omnitrophota bacterium]